MTFQKRKSAATGELVNSGYPAIMCGYCESKISTVFPGCAIGRYEHQQAINSVSKLHFGAPGGEA